MSLRVDSCPQRVPIATYAVRQRPQFNLRALRRLKIEPADAVRVGEGFVENGHIHGLEGSQAAVNIGGTQGYTAGPVVVAMGLDLIDLGALVLKQLQLRAAVQLQHHKALQLAGAMPAELAFPLIRDLARADRCPAEIVRFWPRVCKNASPKLKCARLR